MLLIVMYESGIWRVQPGQTVTFGRGQGCTIKLPTSGHSPALAAHRPIEPIARHHRGPGTLNRADSTGT